MRPHRIARFDCVVLLDCLKNSFVMNLPALRPSRHPEDAQALLAKKSNYRIEQRQDQRILRAFRQCEMKIQVSLNVGIRILPSLVP